MPSPIVPIKRRLEYAKERVQSKDIAAKAWTPVRIIEHPDVRRLLMNVQGVKSKRCARSRSFTAASMDHAHAAHGDRRPNTRRIVEFFTPIVKALVDRRSQPATRFSEALQVFGGMGLRRGDRRRAILSRYPHRFRFTKARPAIQANDLLGRKFLKDMGKTATQADGPDASDGSGDVRGERRRTRPGHRRSNLAKAVDAAQEASLWLGGNALKDLRRDVRGMRFRF